MNSHHRIAVRRKHRLLAAPWRKGRIKSKGCDKELRQDFSAPEIDESCGLEHRCPKGVGKVKLPCPLFPTPFLLSSFCAGLSPVKNLVVQSVTSHDVTLRWENPPGCCSVDHDGRYDRIPSDSWNMSCTAQISGLLAGQKYIMVVYKVLQDAGSSEQRTFISVTTSESY